MDDWQSEREQSRDYHRAEVEFAKFMDKAMNGMTTKEDVKEAWELLNLLGGPRESTKRTD